MDVYPVEEKNQDEDLDDRSGDDNVDKGISILTKEKNTDTSQIEEKNQDEDRNEDLDDNSDNGEDEDQENHCEEDSIEQINHKADVDEDTSTLPGGTRVL